jgi:broad specificity phosphatase PhoE
VCEHDGVPTPARLVLVRHGETDWNRAGRVQGHADIPLNVRGREQAAAVAPRLSGWRFAALYTSTLARAAETAAIIGIALDLAPVPDADWREVHFGELEGAPGEPLTRDHGELVSALARRDRPLAPGGETFTEFDIRIRRGYDAVCAAHPGENVLVVSHGGALKALIARLIGLPPEGIAHLSLRANGGISVVDFRHGRPQLALLNSEDGRVAP